MGLVETHVWKAPQGCVVGYMDLSIWGSHLLSSYSMIIPFHRTCVFN